MIKYVSGLILALAVAVLQAAPGWCAQDVSITARPGLAGIFKVDKPVLVRVYIDNQGGGAVQGYLEATPYNKENSSVFPGLVYRVDVNVPAAGKSARDIVIPGSLASNSPLIRLVSESGIVAETRLEGTGLGGGSVIIPIGEKAVGSGLFAWLDRKYGGQVTVKYLPAGELPDTSLFLGPADVIVADAESARALNPKQIAAIKEWVMLGGTLLLSGYPGEGPFSDISPAGADEGKAMGRADFGRGRVILSGTALEEIRDPDGKTWEDLELLSGEGGLVRVEADEIKHMISNAGSYFPMVNVPGVPVLVLIWVLYVLAVGPGLYLLLRRYNRRDLAWVLVPAGAVLTTLALYAASPLNRQQAYLAHTMSTAEIVNKNLAEVRSSGAFVVPMGGVLEVAGAGQVLLDPADYYSGRGGRGVEIYNSGDRSMVRFENVEFGSMRQVQAYGTSAGLGDIGGRVFFREDRVSGEIKNETPYNLRDCKLVLGRNLLELGDIPAGGSKKLDEPLNWTRIITSPEEIYRVDKASPAMVREQMVVSSYAKRQDNSGEVYFLGWSDTAPGQMNVVRPAGVGQSSGIMLVRKKLTLDFPAGQFSLPAGFVKNQVAGLGGGYGQGPEGLMVHRGSVKVIYDLPGTLNTRDFRVTAIEVPPLPERSSHVVEILRQDNSEWVQVNRAGIIYTGEEVSRYISGQGKVEIRITSPVEKSEAMFNGIAVKGVIGR